MLNQRYSDNEVSKRDIPSFIEPRPPLIQNPFMRPRPQKGTNLLELFEDSEIEDPELPDLVQVYLRLKPCKVPNTLYEVRSDKCLVTSLDTATAGHGRRTQHNVSKMYTFSKIFGPESNQKEIFEDVVKDNLKKLPEGHSFTLLTYGASGSGKTYTLMGTVGAPGLVPRSLEYVFRLVDAAQQPAYKPAENGADKLNYAEQDYELQWVKRLRHISAPLREKYRRMSAQLHCDLTASSIDLSNRVKHYVWVSFVEIYNEAIYDLLAPPDKRTKLRIREDNTGTVYVKGATQAFVRSGEEAYDVMVAGKHNLVVAATGVHANSSRSHCIFTITMLTESGSGGPLRASCVRLCDLAGCERARATRNTGARMAESRAINSSLHVLERCLHMLRRKQRAGTDALVPYRESKLTRLLGSGLSGARGEAVSMVVTLNPSPEYAYETKHVLTLAAVAQDIQINNTMLLASTLESSAQDTTISSGAEVMKLRSDNERLHFELVQAQARNKELLAAMEEKQQEAANTMRELVEEAKDMTRQYYESQIESLRLQMDEMMEEYESRLEQAKASQPPGGSTTPSKILHTRIAELMTDIAVLEEKLTAETLARARAEKEVQHLRTCIDERDEKEKDVTPVSDISDDSLKESSDSENESDKEPEDPLNQSLEPVFKKELNRSVVVHDKLHSDSMSVHTIDNIDEEDEVELDDSADTVKNDDDMPNNFFVETNNINKSAELLDNDIGNDNDMSKDGYENAENIESFHANLSMKDNEANMSNADINGLSSDVEMTNEVKDIDTSFKSSKSEFKDSDSTSDTNMIDNNEVAQEMNIKTINMYRGSYCVQDSIVDARKLSVGNIDPIETTNNVSIVANNLEDDKAFQSDNKCSGTLVSQIIKSLQTNQGSDSSLRQFEQLEQAAKDYQHNRENNKSVFGDIKIPKVKRTYFDDNVTTKDIISTSIAEDYPQCNFNTEKRTYFDNIGVPETNSDKVNEIKHINVERSPSIVKDFVSDQFEPNTIKKLLGERENSIKPDILSVHKIKLAKKHDSVDIFEGFDSPAFIAKVQEKIDNVELARKSIERLVLEQQTKKPKTAEDATITCPTVLEKVVDQRGELIIVEDKSKKALKKSSINIIPDIEHETQTLQANTESSEIDSVKLPKAVEPDNALNNELQEINVVKLPNTLKLQPLSSLDTPFEKEKAIIKTEIKLEPSSSIDEPNQTMNSTQSQTNVNNTIEEFDNIYKDITAPRETEFEMLLSHNQDTSDTDMIVNSKNGETKETERKINKGGDIIKPNEVSESKPKTDNQTEEIKYNLRNKRETTTTKRTLRLRRKKNDSGEDTSQEIVDTNSQPKLKDIVNLQSEFSDVTLDIPATKKDVKDIPSPEKYYTENLPPILGIQSCPSKSITRSRRKLFTPRAEPLEESLSQTGDSNERVYVPRPSYHRPRARRKL